MAEETQYLKSRYNQAINITKTFSDDLVVPIIYYSELPNLYVKLAINKYERLSDNGVDQVLQDTTGVRTLKLSQQTSQINGFYAYGVILNKNELPQLGVYTGNVTVFQSFLPSTNTGSINPLLDMVPVTVIIEPNPLALNTEFLQSDGINRYSYADIISTLFNYLYVSPRFVTTNENGQLIVRYNRKNAQDRVFLFRDSNGSYLPTGSTVTVISKVSGKPQDQYFRYPLLKTNDRGQDTQTLEQITNDGKASSFVVVSDIPVGEYFIFAEYFDKGGLNQTAHQQFVID